MKRLLRGVILSIAACAAIGGAGLAPAAWAAPSDSARLEASLEAGRQALDEGRYLDVASVLARAALARIDDPRLALLEGELALRTGRPAVALDAFGKAGTLAPTAALQGQGLALSALGRWDEAGPMLLRAVQLEPKAWRAWNALGVCRDRTSDWVGAEAAYAEALRGADRPAAVLNNRGYSRLLQQRTDAAVEDLTAALRHEPGLTSARTNLRLALAMQGDYARASAPSELFSEDPNAILNNVALAAASRGDIVQARAMLQKAITGRGVYYPTAEDNLRALRSAAPNASSDANAAQ